jgi:hypothetical protein
MTQEEAARRRCAECGRFLPSDSADGLCSSCHENATGTTAERHTLGNGSANGQAKSLTQVRFGTPITRASPVHGATASLSTGAIRPPRGVVIMRPSELHPEQASPAALKAPEAWIERDEPKTAVEIQPRIRPHAERPPEPLPERRVAERQERAPERRPAQVPTYRPQEEPLTGVDLGVWALRIVLGVVIGTLMGLAIPLILSL